MNSNHMLTSGSVPSSPSKGAKKPKGGKRGGGFGLSDPRPYNHYNLYFILERELFLQGRGVYPPPDADAGIATDVDYSGLAVPSLPARYADVVLSHDWYVHRRKKRAHVKTHGILSFREMAAMVAARWKDEDAGIVEFVKTVADSVKRRYDDYKLIPLQAAVMQCRGVVGEPADRARFLHVMRLVNQGRGMQGQGPPPPSSSVMQSSMMQAGGPMNPQGPGPMNPQGRGPLTSSTGSCSSPMSDSLLASPVRQQQPMPASRAAMGPSLPFQRSSHPQMRSQVMMPLQRASPQHHMPARCPSMEAAPYMGPDFVCRGVSQGSDAVVDDAMTCGGVGRQGPSMMTTSPRRMPSSLAMFGRGDGRGSDGYSSSNGANANSGNIASVDMCDDEIFAMWSSEDAYF